MLRYKTETRPGLVALYDIRPRNGVGQFLQPRSPHGACLLVSPQLGHYTSFTTAEVTITRSMTKSNQKEQHTPKIYWLTHATAIILIIIVITIFNLQRACCKNDHQCAIEFI